MFAKLKEAIRVIRGKPKECRQWPDLNSVWSQEVLRKYVRQMGITPEENEIIPQGVKWVPWPQPKPTADHIRRGQQLAKELQARVIKP